jgi:hypothetical protein
LVDACDAAIRRQKRLKTLGKSMLYTQYGGSNPSLTTLLTLKTNKIMKKVSAVEWLVEQLEGDDAIIARVIGLKKYNEIYKKAKEMEKEQIKDAFVECWKANMPDGYECKLSAEEYYNETFKNK